MRSIEGSEDEGEETPRLNPYLADVRPLTPVARGGKRSLAYALSAFRPESPPPEEEGAQVFNLHRSIN